MLYHPLCQWKIQSLYNLQFNFLLFCQGYIQQKEVHQFLIYQERDFLHYLNGILNLGLCSWILCYGKTLKLQRVDAIHHMFLTHQLHLMQTSVDLFFIPSKILQKLLLVFFGGNVAIWASKVSVLPNLVGSLSFF